MLSELLLHNFRTHKDTHLRFNEHMNVVWGKSNSGKSNIVRGLLWLIENRPLGRRVVSRFEKKGVVKVAATIDDHTLSMQKTKSTAVYTVDGEEYRGFGDKVPDIATEIVNLSEVSVQGQLNPNFLISLTSGSAGKVLNRVTRIEEVDTWIEELNRDITRNKATLLSQTQTKQDKENELMRYCDLEEMEDDVGNLEITEATLGDLTDMVETLIACLDDLYGLRREAERLAGAEEAKSGVEQIEKHTQELARIASDIVLLEPAVEVAKQLSSRHQEEQIWQFALKHAGDYGEIVEQYKALGDIVGEYHHDLDQIDIRTKEKSKLEEELRQLMEGVEECPLCLTIITDKEITNMLGSMGEE